MRYVTVEVKVDEDDDAAAENVVMAALDAHLPSGRNVGAEPGVVGGIVTFQVTEIAAGWSQAARDLGAHRG